MPSSELRGLLEKYINDTISAEEFKELWASLEDRRFDDEWYSSIEQVLRDKKMQGLSDPEQMTARLAQIRSLMDTDGQTAQRKPVVRHIARYAAAAAIIIMAAGTYLLSHHSKTGNPIAVSVPQAPAPIKPGTQKAILTLADGSTVALDNAANGMIAQQGATQVLKLANGQIRYQTGQNTADKNNAAIQGKPAYNIMSTPNGGQYQLTLPDGTNVWLNAASSITYPCAFTGDERKVKITGEVYFEVAKDKSKPFLVTAGDQEIEVLGTHFNVNAYTDEDHIKTSLLEGSVRVNNVLLHPGQAFAQGKTMATNVEQDIAWKNGVFNFNNQSLAQVMRQLARWYDLEIVYPQGVPQKEYGGEIGKNLTLDQVLKGLENSGIHFILNGRRLTVRS